LRHIPPHFLFFCLVPIKVACGYFDQAFALRIFFVEWARCLEGPSRQCWLFVSKVPPIREIAIVRHCRPPPREQKAREQQGRFYFSNQRRGRPFHESPPRGAAIGINHDDPHHRIGPRITKPYGVFSTAIFPHRGLARLLDRVSNERAFPVFLTGGG
jgi:hypothetical protein